MKYLPDDEVDKWCKATEIQELFTDEFFHYDDNYFCTEPGFPGGCISLGRRGIATCKSCNRDLVWVPTQEQLQGMVDSEDSVYDIIKRFADWVEANWEYLARYFFTHQDIWLAYIMAVNHGKQWYGDRWCPWGFY